MSNQQKLNDFFAKINDRLATRVPAIIAETATEYFKESFRTKSFDGIPWKETKKKAKRGSLMVRSGALMSTIRPSTISPAIVKISAGSSRVPYARVHNEGESIKRAARSETFVRNRHTKGIKKGSFKRGTSSGKGFSFKSFEYKMPKRQFMGHTAELNRRIMTRVKAVLKGR